jgi:hypothetical protein
MWWGLVALAAALPACTPRKVVPDRGLALRGYRLLEFEAAPGAFPDGDLVLVDRVWSSGEWMADGERIRVQGRWVLGSVDSATLHLAVGWDGASTEKYEIRESEMQRIERGEGTFELAHELAGPGIPEVQLFDERTGLLLGSVRFGIGERAPSR